MADVSSQSVTPPLKKLKQSSDPPLQHQKKKEPEVEDDLDYDKIPPVDYDLAEKYFAQIEESEGFDFDYFSHPWIPIHPLINLHETTMLLALVNSLSTVAIQHFNSENNEDYEFVKVEKVNSELVAGCIYYITFQARKAGADPKDDSALKTFQTRVWDPIPPQPVEVEFCRLKHLP